MLESVSEIAGLARNKSINHYLYLLRLHVRILLNHMSPNCSFDKFFILENKPFKINIDSGLFMMCQYNDDVLFIAGLALAVGVGVVVGTILGAILLVCVYTVRKG